MRFIIILSIFIISCNVEEVYVDVYDPEQERIDSLDQRSSDISLIYDYLDGQNINSVDTSASGVFYTITDTGEGLKYPEINDLVSIVVF